MAPIVRMRRSYLLWFGLATAPGWEEPLTGAPEHITLAGAWTPGVHQRGRTTHHELPVNGRGRRCTRRVAIGRRRCGRVGSSMGSTTTRPAMSAASIPDPQT